MLGYDTQGDHETHRAEATVILTYVGVDATPDQIVICTVAQHAVTNELMTVIFPRDTLAVETVTYSAIKGLAQELGLRLEALTMEREGVVPDAFERLCQTRPPKAL